jgi:membrane protein
MEQLQGVLGPDAALFVETAVMNSRIEESGIWPTVMGVLAIVLGATTVFAQMQKSLNQIWDVAPRPSRSGLWLLVKARLLSLATVLAIGFVLLVSLLLSVAMRTVMAFAEQWLPLPPWLMVTAENAIALAVTTGLFAAIFKILPDVVLRWRDVLPGALVTALLFSLGRSLIALYLATTATASTYGAAGSLVLLLLWVNYSALILLFGAAVTRAYFEARGNEILPRNTAVRVSQVTVSESPTADEEADRTPA